MNEVEVLLIDKINHYLFEPMDLGNEWRYGMVEKETVLWEINERAVISAMN